MKNIVFCAPLKTLSGYGARSRDIALSLIEIDSNVKFIATPWGDTPNTGLDLNNESHRKIYQRIVPNINEQPDIWIQCTIPNEFQSVGKYNIGITAGIETTICRPEWVEGCNRMNLVLVSSNHSKNVFTEIQFEKRDQRTQALIEVIKLNVPCEVLFEGIDTTIYKKTSKISNTVSEFMSNVSEEFCFLFVGHWLQGDLGHDRKDIGMLIKTFLDAFKKKAPQNRPALILKTSHANFSKLELTHINHKIDSIRQMIYEAGFKGELPNIYVLYGDLSDEEMNSLYNHDKIKAMVSFTKGEGFGRPLAEFTLTGKPVLCSNWSGVIDFLQPDKSFLIPGSLGPVHQSAVND